MHQCSLEEANGSRHGIALWERTSVNSNNNTTDSLRERPYCLWGGGLLMFQDMGIDEQGIRNVGLDGVIPSPLYKLI